MKKILTVLILLSTLLAGCSNYTKEEEAKEADFVNGVALIEELLRVGDEMKLEKVTMSDRYNLLYEDYNGELKWLSLNEHHGVAYVVKKSKEPYSYIVREENKVKNCRTVAGFPNFLFTSGLKRPY